MHVFQQFWPLGGSSHNQLSHDYQLAPTRSYQRVPVGTEPVKDYSLTMKDNVNAHDETTILCIFGLCSLLRKSLPGNVMLAPSPGKCGLLFFTINTLVHFYLFMGKMEPYIRSVVVSHPTFIEHNPYPQV